MGKIEQQLKPEDIQAQISKTREQFEKERNFRAKEKNRYRTVWQKILGREKNYWNGYCG